MLWDIFCRVIDNHGDIGVCWRLGADLAARGQQVRLWVDDGSALRWMAPGALEAQDAGVRVWPWEQSRNAAVLDALPPADVWIEAFGCDIPAAFVAHRAHASPAPVWINLEYLSAEAYVERSHCLPSPVHQGPAAGWTKTFFYPGFTARTGGLLREPELMQRLAREGHAGARCAFLAALGLPGHGERLITLFCYEPALLPALLVRLANSPMPTRLLVTAGRATAAVQAALGAQPALGRLAVSYLPYLTQREYDRLLWHADVNFVRGEDSVVRALWAGKPFVWQIYAQDDGAHAAKLEAFLDCLALSPAVRALHRAWNGLPVPGRPADALAPLDTQMLAQWQSEVLAARARLLEMDDLLTQLLQFVQKKR